jgi:PAS domain S-box-containing protein/diguanylate cyclase (GGDEF)-like protein
MTTYATEQQTRAALLDSQRRVLERIANGAPLREILETLIRLIEEQADGLRCAVLLADTQQQRLRFAAAPSIPEDYKTGIDAFLRIAPEMGSCGTAAFLREPVYTEDTATDPLWKDCGNTAVRNGLRACWSTPILSDDNAVLGTFAMYYGEPRLPSPEHIQLIDMATQMARVAIEAKGGEELLRTVFECAPGGIGITDLAGNIIRVNPAFARLIGYTQAELQCKTIAEVTHDDDYPYNKALIDELFAGKRQQFVIDKRYRRKDGEIIWVHNTVAFLRGPAEEPRYMVALIEDITERREHERKFTRLSRVQAVLSGINSAIVRVHSRDELFRDACRIAVGAGQFRMAWVGVVDREAMRVKPVAWDGEVRDFFDTVPLALTETKPGGQGMTGQAVREKKPVISNDIQNDPQRLMKKECAERGINSLAALPLIVDGEVVGVLTLYAGELGFFDSEEMKLLGELASDIAFAIKHLGHEERLTYLAYYDALTGLPNRALFHERLTQLLHAAKHSRTPVVVAVGDINRFRLINDTFGRQVGDTLLREFAQCMKTIWPEPDRVARISADIFAGALAEVTEPGNIAHSIDKTVAALLEEPFAVEGKEIRIATTAGVAVFPTDGEDADTLFRNAEAALKKAKASGERYLFYRPEMNARVAETLLLENKLRQAIKLDQFVLHYQPKVDGTSGRVSGLEALIRWQDPETGLVPPLKFIPILEETGMILEVGQWAIRKALEDSHGWRMANGRPPRIAVNVSPIQLQQRNFVEAVHRSVEEAGGEECQLDLEITEGLIMRDIEANIKKLSAIRELGLQIAIDDFGTGYSSLGYLAKLPVNALKIDRSFIITMTSNPQSMTIVSTIISLAHSLGLKVIAEGVDAEEQAKFLRLLRCDEMQGYLFSRPVPPDKVEDLLNRIGSEGNALA